MKGVKLASINSEALEYGFEIPTLIRNSFMVYLRVL